MSEQKNPYGYQQLQGQGIQPSANFVVQSAQQPAQTAANDESAKYGALPVPAGQGAPPISVVRKCNCKQSRCIKLYCECYANGVYCSGCHCVACLNNSSAEDWRKHAIANTLERNPFAFQPKISVPTDPKIQESVNLGKHNKGCACKKSGCMKKYCECFQAGVHCSENCKCSGCQNTDYHFQMAMLKQTSQGRDDEFPSGNSAMLFKLLLANNEEHLNQILGERAQQPSRKGQILTQQHLEHIAENLLRVVNGNLSQILREDDGLAPLLLANLSRSLLEQQQNQNIMPNQNQLQQEQEQEQEQGNDEEQEHSEQIQQDQQNQPVENVNEPEKEAMVDEQQQPIQTHSNEIQEPVKDVPQLESTVIQEDKQEQLQEKQDLFHTPPKKSDVQNSIAVHLNENIEQEQDQQNHQEQHYSKEEQEKTQGTQLDLHLNIQQPEQIVQQKSPENIEQSKNLLVSDDKVDAVRNLLYQHDENSNEIKPQQQIKDFALATQILEQQQQKLLLQAQTPLPVQLNEVNTPSSPEKKDSVVKEEGDADRMECEDERLDSSAEKIEEKEGNAANQSASRTSHQEIQGQHEIGDQYGNQDEQEKQNWVTQISLYHYKKKLILYKFLQTLRQFEVALVEAEQAGPEAEQQYSLQQGSDAQLPQVLAPQPINLKNESLQ